MGVSCADTGARAGTLWRRGGHAEFPLRKGGGAERQGVVGAVFLGPLGQPPEGFAFLPPLLRGNLRELPQSGCQVVGYAELNLPGTKPTESENGR